MDRGPRRDRRARHGGTLGLAEIVARHGEAVEYDLITRTRYTLDDVGGELPERALLAFVRRLPMESETRAALSPDCGWSRTEHLLARLCEGVEQLAWIESCKGLKKSKWPPRPKRIQRPGVEPDGKRVGRDPIPISDFDDWYYGGDA